jgi:hypothetical protein
LRVIDPTGTAVWLRRGLFARLFAGTPFQWILTVAIVLDVVLVSFVLSFTSLGTVAPALGPALVPVLVWLVGVLASAAADLGGIRWRYYSSHRYAWSDVERLRFGSRLTVAGMATVGEAAIFVQVRGREHPIVPAYGCRRSRQLEFGDALIRLADTHGVAVTIAPDDAWWAALQPG